MYYKATEIIKETAQDLNTIVTVSHGAFEDIDLKRQTLFPLLHVVPNGFSIDSTIVTYNFEIYFCDLVDFNKDDVYNDPNPYWTNDNAIDVLNNTSLAAQLFVDKIKRGKAYTENIQIGIGQTGTFFTNSVENLLAGCQLNISITMPNSSVTDGIC